MKTPNRQPRTNGLKAFACGVVALALTAGFSWSFVNATAVARLGGSLPQSLLARVHLLVHA